MTRTLTAAILLAMTVTASAQNMSQMGNVGTRDCTTQRCIDNVKRTMAGEKGLCITDRDCGR
jgi:hypothetical protein